MSLTKTKRIKQILKMAVAPLAITAIVAGGSYGLIQSAAGSNVVNQSPILNPQVKVTAADVKILPGTVDSEPVVDANGNYIVPAIVLGNKAGVAKLDTFGAPQYAWVDNEASDAGYIPQQIVQNYDSPGTYYVLLVNPTVVVSMTNDATLSTTIDKPAKIIQINDTGTDFNQVASHSLQLPKFNINAENKAFFDKLIVRAPIQATTTNDQLMETYNNTNTSALLPTGHLWETWSGHSKNIITELYLNSIKNLAYISSAKTGKKALLVFGGNDLPSLWFYDMPLVDQPAQTNDEFGRLYANYKFNWTNQRLQMKFLNDNKLALPAYFIGGAKTIVQNEHYPDGTLGKSPQRYLMIAITKPNFAETADSFLINSSAINAGAGAGFTQAQSSERGAQTIWTYMNPETAIDTSETDANTMVYQSGNVGDTTTPITNYTLFQVSSSDGWAGFPFPTNPDWTTGGYYGLATAYGVTPVVSPNFKGDGWLNSASQKIIAFQPQVLNYGPNSTTGVTLDRVASLLYMRSEIVLLRYNDNMTSNTSSLRYPIFLNSNNKVIDFTNLQSISYNNNTWFLNYYYANPTEGKPFSQIYAFSWDGVDSQGNNLVSFNATTIKETNSKIISVAPLSSTAVYTISEDASGKQTTQLWNENSAGAFIPNTGFNADQTGVPTYKDNPKASEIWGTISFRDSNYLSQAGYYSSTSAQIADAGDRTMLNNLLVYTPAWPGQQTPRIISNASDNQKLGLSVAVQYYNGKWYSSAPESNKADFPDVIFDSALGFPSVEYAGFLALPSWVLPVAIGGSIGAAAIILGLGLGIGIPMHKNRKMQDKGFTNTYKKVDTLTSAVGSVYKKIVTQTSIAKKTPQLLKSTSTKPTTPGTAATKPATAKPATPVKPVAAKPTAPGTVKPVAPKPTVPTKPVGPTAPTTSVKPVAPKPASPTMPVKPAAPKPIGPKPS